MNLAIHLEELKVRRKALDLEIGNIEAAIQKDLRDRRTRSYVNARTDAMRTGEWLRLNQILKDGDIIWVTGSRSGKEKKVLKATLSELVLISSDGRHITDTMYNKVTHIQRNGEMIKISKLMENNQSA